MNRTTSWKNNTLTKQTIIYAFGNFSSKLASFLLIFFVTYFLDKSAVGEYDLIFNALSFLVPFISLQIGTSVFRWLLEDSKTENLNLIVGNTFFLLFVNYTIYSIVFWSLNFYYHFSWALYIYLISILQTFHSIIQQILRATAKTFAFVLSGIATSLLTVLFAVVNLCYFKMTLEGILLAHLFSLLIVSLVLSKIINLHTFISFNISRSLLKSMLKYSLPLLPNNFSWWLITSSTRFIILYFLGVDKNGLFAIAYKFPSIVLMVGDVFYMAWQEKVIMESLDVKSNSLALEKYIRFLFTSIILVSCISKVAIAYLAQESFSQAWKYTPILLYATLVQSVVAFYGAAYLSRKDTRGVIGSSVIGAVVTISISVLGTKSLGLYGTSMAILLGFIVVLIIRIRQTKEYFPVIFPYKLWIQFTIVFILVSVANYIDNIVIFTLSLIVSIILFFTYNKDIFFQLKSEGLKV